MSFVLNTTLTPLLSILALLHKYVRAEESRLSLLTNSPELNSLLRFALSRASALRGHHMPYAFRHEEEVNLDRRMFLYRTY
jgi:hypothetical protein